MADIVPFEQRRGDPSLETRIRNPVEYWCHGPAGGEVATVRTYWGELPVTREEYLKYSGKPDCADPKAVADWMRYLGHDDES